MLRHIILAFAVAAAAPATPAAAQWAIGAEVSAARFWGASREDSGGRSLRPYRPTVVGVVGARSFGATSVTAHGYYARTSLALEGGDAVVAVKNALTLYGVAIEVSYRLVSLGHESSLMVGTGPLVERWDLSGTTAHLRAGLGATLALRVAPSDRWEAALRGGIAVSGSPFTSADLDSGFAPRALWRRQVAARVMLRL